MAPPCLDSRRLDPRSRDCTPAVAPPSGTYDICFEAASFSPAVDVASPVVVAIEVHQPAQAAQSFGKMFTAPTSTNGTCNSSLDTYVGSITLP